MHDRSLLTIIFSLALAAGTADAQNTVQATLTGFHVVPPKSTPGSGLFQLTVSADGLSMTYALSYSNLKGIASVADLHFGSSAGQGGVVVILCGGADRPGCPPSGTATGTITAADVQQLQEQGISGGDITAVLDAIASAMAYVEVHTDRFPAGEIRGQIGGADALDSGIEGTTLLRPTCPVITSPPSGDCQDKPFQAAIVVKALTGLPQRGQSVVSKEVARFSSNSDGEFRISLPPGPYSLESAGTPIAAPQYVTVESGKFATVTMHFDTGIR